MQVHRTLPTTPILDNSALTIGTFDGVHLGHQQLIRHLKAHADERDLQTVALTFDDMPICLLRPEICPALLTLANEKIAAFAQTPLDHLFVVPFTWAIASQSARQWMQTWIDNIGLKLFVGGPDFALGRNREGTIAQLQALGSEMGFHALALEEKLCEGDAPVSSTRSRHIIEAGEVERSVDFLGRRYQLTGDVVGGQQLGRTIGFPTINVRPDPRKCLPSNGVYAVWFLQENKRLPAALNIGSRPTVAGESLQIEFHVIDHVIGRPSAKATVEFVARMRSETKFDNLQELQSQLKSDVKMASLLLNKTG